MKLEVSYRHSFIGILRILSMMHYDHVIGHQWHVCNVLAYVYGPPEDTGDLENVFPEAKGLSETIVSGERLMERAGLIHVFEDVVCSRLVNGNGSASDLRIVCDGLPPYILEFEDEVFGKRVEEMIMSFEGYSP